MFKVHAFREHIGNPSRLRQTETKLDATAKLQRGMYATQLIALLLHTAHMLVRRSHTLAISHQQSLPSPPAYPYLFVLLLLPAHQTHDP